MPKERMIHKEIKLLYENRSEGDLLMDTPATERWEKLVSLAVGRKEWRQREGERDQEYSVYTSDKRQKEDQAVSSRVRTTSP